MAIKSSTVCSCELNAVDVEDLRLDAVDVEDLSCATYGLAGILKVLDADDVERQYALDADDPSTAHPMSEYRRGNLMAGAEALVRMINKTLSAAQSQRHFEAPALSTTEAGSCC